MCKLLSVSESIMHIYSDTLTEVINAVYSKSIPTLFWKRRKKFKWQLFCMSLKMSIQIPLLMEHLSSVIKEDILHSDPIVGLEMTACCNSIELSAVSLGDAIPKGHLRQGRVWADHFLQLALKGTSVPRLPVAMMLQNFPCASIVILERLHYLSLEAVVNWNWMDFHLRKIESLVTYSKIKYLIMPEVTVTTIVVLFIKTYSWVCNDSSIM